MEMIEEVHFERWDEDEFIIIIPGIGPCGRTLHKHDAEIIKRWLNTGAISEIKKPYIELAKKWRGPDSEKYARNLGIDIPLLNLCASELETINKSC